MAHRDIDEKDPESVKRRMDELAREIGSLPPRDPKLEGLVKEMFRLRELLKRLTTDPKE